VLAKKLNLVGLGQSLVVIDVVFLVAGLLSKVSARLGFQDLVFGDLTSMLSFIARGWLHGLLISFCFFLSFCSLISLHLSSLITSLVALPFTIFATPGLDSVDNGLKFKLWFLGGWLTFPHTQSFVVLRWHERL
ncbi:LOW QUALITY PROTEIN: hypothetical protein HID58_085201, partial [Brassica napus]